MLRTERRTDGSHGYYIRCGRTLHATANVVLDLRGTVCPGPIVEARKLLASMKPGETLELLSNCPGVADDVSDWIKATGHTLVAVDETGAGEFSFHIARR